MVNIAKNNAMYLGAGVTVEYSNEVVKLYTPDMSILLGKYEVKALFVWFESQGFNINSKYLSDQNDCYNCEGFGQIRESRKCCVCNRSGKK